jgi:phosphatidylglycerol:prolipoprotein diacylglycerol transferase
MLAGIGISLAFWIKLARKDSRLMFIYASALVGAFLGAKLVYILAEGWRDFGQPDMWPRLATGKSIVGALLGGYAAVELAKKAFCYNRATGDWFSAIVPIGIMLGRIGCFLHGCCLGKPCADSWFTIQDNFGTPRWPAVPVEFAFNALMLGVFFFLRRSGKFAGQHFHIYLMSYGLFRFAHEFLRDTPTLVLGISGYQIAALAVATLGAIGYRLRRKKLTPTPPESPSPSQPPRLAAPFVR